MLKLLIIIYYKELKLIVKFLILYKLYFRYLLSLIISVACQLQVITASKELNLEPLSIISVIFQLATVSPEVNKFFKKEENSDFTRTQVIEFYRSNMKSNIIEKNKN